MKTIIYEPEQLAQIVAESTNISEVCRAYGIGANSGNYKTIKSKIEEYAISITHFNRGDALKGNACAIKHKLDDVLIQNSPYKNTPSLKRRLIKEGLLHYSCFICEIEQWQGKPLTLQLDHINGVNTDNTLSNLRLLCPNCHAQTDTYGGSNAKH